ncbi:MAG: formate dehydrogenase accessory sulfurtransferase FdhD [Rhizobiales bacterium]|nr:formate dehydrogenase accessory sulfurtransferase FdhD [Hyphomicrobiales bacterium]
MTNTDETEFQIAPDPENTRLSQEVEGLDQDGKPVSSHVVHERPPTIFLNDQEIVTSMTIGDHPDWLAVGYLLNQGMLNTDDEITAIEYDDDLELVVVRTARQTNYEEKLKKKVRTSGCAQGTVFGDVMENFETASLASDAVIRTSWLHTLTKKINTAPSLYLKAGAIHGCVLCNADKPLVYLEDVGRHNAVDKIAGWMFLNKIRPDDKIFYTTGRLTSEMIIKCVGMGIPILVSRSGFTAWGVELARQVGLTLIGRARGKRFLVLSGEKRIIFDADSSTIPDEDRKHRRKAAMEDAG